MTLCKSFPRCHGREQLFQMVPETSPHHNMRWSGTRATPARVRGKGRTEGEAEGSDEIERVGGDHWDGKEEVVVEEPARAMR